MNSTDLVSTKLLRMKVTLPYWTSMVSGSISFFIGLHAVTRDWDRSDDKTWSLSFSSVVCAIGLLYTFIDNLALLINIVHNFHNLGMVTPLTGSAYIVPFAGSATLWTPRVTEYAIPLVLGWITVLIAVTNFVVLSLPAVGTVGLYEAYSPHCTVLFNAKSTSGCTNATMLDVFGGLGSGSFVCAQQGPTLGFGAAPGFLPIVVDWAYAVVIVVLLAFTLWRHFLSRRTGQPQPVGFVVAPVMFCAIFICLGLAITTWYFAIRTAAEGSVGVCPGISNATVGPIRGNMDVASGCACVELRMPGYVANVGEVLREDRGSIWRLISDFA